MITTVNKILNATYGTAVYLPTKTSQNADFWHKYLLQHSKTKLVT